MRFLPAVLVLGLAAVVLAATGYFQGLSLAVPENGAFPRKLFGIELFGQIKDEPDEESFEFTSAPPDASDFWLGVRCDCVTDVLRAQLKISNGLVIDDVLPNTPADRAGLVVNDVIVSVDGNRISCCKLLNSLVQGAKQDGIRLEVLREGKKLFVTVVPEPRPQCEVLINPLVFPNDAGQLVELPQSDIVALCNPLTGEVSIVVLNRGLVLSQDSTGRLRDNTREDLPLTVEQMNRLAIDYDWQSLSQLSGPKVQEILSLAIDAASSELNRLENTIERCLAEEVVVRGLVDQLQKEATAVETYIAGLRRLVDEMANLPADSLQQEPPQFRESPESNREHGPRDTKFQLVAGV